MSKQVLLVALLAVLGLAAAQLCTLDDYDKAYTACTNNEKTAVWFKKAGHQCSGGVSAPDPVFSIPCDLTCNAGEYLEFASKTTAGCKKCQGGSYSLGGGVRVSNWESTKDWRSIAPSSAIQFKTSCFDSRYPDFPYAPQRCPGWIIRDGYADSAEEPEDYDSSVLEMTVSLVRTGSVMFEYRVDAESGYDALYVEVDGVVSFGPVSHQLDYTRHSFNLSAGFHVIKFRYTKDFSLSEGADRAFLKLIEVKGTDYADAQCYPCPAGTFSSALGSPECTLCTQDSYTNWEGATTCAACDEHSYAYPGSTVCTARLPCTANDYTIITTPCASDLTRDRTYQWLLPKICDDAVAGAVTKPTDQFHIACAPCNPGSIRQASGACSPCPLNTASPGNNAPCTTCGSGTVGRRDITWNSFIELPPNVNYQTHCDGACGTTGWRRTDSYMDSGRGHGDYVSNWFVLPVTIEGTGSVSFNVSFECSRSCQLSYIDSRVLSDGSREIVRSRTLYSVFYPRPTMQTFDISSGDHELAFYFQKYDSRLAAREDRALIWSIEIDSVAQGGASKCVTCAAGQWADASTALCKNCDAGKYSAAGATTCTNCARDRFSEAPGSALCTVCGAGTFAEPGSAECTPANGCTFAADASTVYNFTALSRVDDMYGPLTETPSSYEKYFLNICSKRHSNHTCMDPDGAPLPTFACLTSYSDVGTDIGHVLSFAARPDRAGADLIFTGGSSSLCGFLSSNKAQSRVKMICDPDAGTGAPVADVPVEATTCHYAFTWRSVHACPMCTQADYEYYYTDCINGRHTQRWKPKESPQRCHGGLELPADKPNLACIPNENFRCEAGTHKVDGCVACSEGEYSFGGGVDVTTFWPKPAGFSTSCRAQDCEPWMFHENYAESGMWSDGSTLEVVYSFARAGSFSFRYEAVLSANQVLAFYVDNVLAKEITVTTLNISTVASVSVTAGTHNFRWTLHSPQSNEGYVRLYGVSVVGTRYHDLLCYECPMGTFQNKEGQTSCLPCPSNTYNNATGRDSCIPCAADQWAPPGAWQCEPSPPCTVADHFVRRYGVCSNGQIPVRYEYSQPQICRGGSALPSAESIPCACPEGMFISASGQCQPCATGEYYDTVSKSCLLAPVGRVATRRHYLAGPTRNVYSTLLAPPLSTACTGQCASAWRFNGQGVLDSGLQRGDSNSWLRVTVNVLGSQGSLVATYKVTGPAPNALQIAVNGVLVSNEGPTTAAVIKTLALTQGRNIIDFNFHHSIESEMVMKRDTNDATAYHGVVINTLYVEGTAEGGAVLITCPAGTYSPSTGGVECTPCAPGTYAPASALGSQKCLPCEIGTYSYFPGAAACTKCGNAGYTLASGATICETNCTFTDTQNYKYDLRQLATRDREASSRSWPDSRFVINTCKQVSDNDCKLGHVCANLAGAKYNFGHNIEFIPPEFEGGKETLEWFLHFADGDFCKTASGNTTRRSTILRMECDAAMGSELGTPRLVAVESTECQAVFEWQTPAACPSCGAADFEAQVGRCEGGKQKVTFKASGSCYDSGHYLPETYEQSCTDIEFPILAVFGALAAFVVLVIIVVVIFIKNRRMATEYQLLKDSQASDVDRTTNSIQLDAELEEDKGPASPHNDL